MNGACKQPSERPGVELLLVRSDPPCRRCRRAEEVLRAAAEARPDAVAFRTVRRDEPEAAAYGPVLTPMVVMNGKIVCAGMAPTAAGLDALIARELGR